MSCGTFSLTIVFLSIVGGSLLDADPSPPRACVTPDNFSGECVQLKTCKHIMDMRSALRKEDAPFLFKSLCGRYGTIVYVCCRLDGRTLPEPGEFCTTIDDRIYQGTQTKIDEHPWVALIINKGEPFKFQCGGSLINQRYVLTAAHCMNSKNDTSLKVRLGEWDITTNEDCYTDALGNVDCADSHVDIEIEKIIIHENYTLEYTNDLNDIALIRLARYIFYTEFIQPICLPIKDNLRNASLDEQVMEVVGWGQTEVSSSSERKLKASVRVVPLEDCRKVYDEVFAYLRSYQMCAQGENGTDSCKGDSGGPLIGTDNSMQNKVYLYVAGIVAQGPTPCGTPGVPAVYTRVTSYVDWIKSNLEP